MNPVTAEAIKQQVESDPTIISMTDLAIKLGILKMGQSLSGRQSKQIRESFPEIDTILKERKVHTSKPENEPITDKPNNDKLKTVKKKSVQPRKYPRHPKNPFRLGSSYGIAVDILASHPGGMSKDKLAEIYGKMTGKDAQHARYDLAVIYSAKPDSRHKSCKSGFNIVRENDHVKIVFD